MSVEYSICVTHYNMCETVEKSLQSILDQIDEKFEVVVVDDGSDDGSLEILRRLNDEYDQLRLIELERDPNRSLGQTRNISIEKARGEYVFLQYDMDTLHDYAYSKRFKDFAEIFRQIESQVDFDFFGVSKIVKKEFLQKKFGGYRDLPIGAEDRDLLRRILDKEARISLKIKKPLAIEIGPGKSFLEKIKRGFLLKYGDLKAGISFWSYIKWSIFEDSKWKIPYNLLFVTLGYTKLILEVYLGNGKRYEAPKAFEEIGTLEKVTKQEEKTLPEIEEEYGIKIDRSRLSKEGQEIFYE